MPIFKDLFKFFSKNEESVSEPEPKGYSYEATSPLASLLNLSTDRMERYAEYEKMMEMPYVAAAAKVYVDECCQRNPDTGKIFAFSSKNPKVEKLIKELFDRIKIEEKCPFVSKELFKLGDSFWEVVSEEGIGVTGIYHRPAGTIERKEDEKGRLEGFKQNIQGKTIDFEPDEMIHFRLLEDAKFYPYGYPILEDARRIYRQLALMEDAVVIYRLTRAPNRWVFYIDVGNMAPEKAEAFIDRLKKKFKKKRLIDPKTGKFVAKPDFLAADEDFYFPVFEGGRGSRVESLAGASNIADIADIEYFQKMLFAALKIPKAYLANEEGFSTRATLSSISIQFSRSVKSIQNAIVDGVKKLIRIHLEKNGIKDAEFTLTMHSPNYIEEDLRMESLLKKVQIAQELLSLTDKEGNSLVNKDFILKNILGLTDKEIGAMKKEGEGNQ
ncbi:Bacteriophage T4-like capsid assembly protein (Gp20) [Balnearium lithotrophicum]|uniref:Bacteriophage T4-like capsid assembly protein (Gp20) n=1 Tax=Balnearium lithotrophicum TaxID=223788 RepID=A0A521CJH4_9BACT|nr:portal protein [Balnearium lithotrophicum]SMO59588.1 Bacteriophage T4-like capsid assembly protein (Gp20) [Balnearium lithotrophicum]